MYRDKKRKKQPETPANETGRFSRIISAIAAGLVFWVIETLLEVYVFKFGGSFITQLVSPSLHALWMRAQLAGLIIVVVLYLQNALQRRQSELKLKHLNRQLSRSYEEWEKAFDTIPDLVFVVDSDFRVQRANRAFAYATGVSKQEIIGKKCFELVHGTSSPPDWCPHNLSLKDGEGHVTEIYEEKLKGYYQISVNPISVEDGKFTATIHVARNITDRKMMEQKLREVAMTDALTGLLNRRGFYMFAEQQCRLADRSGRVLPMLYIDLDGMKTINDKLGHLVGDQALIDTAVLLRKSFRESDIIARLGGDEFAVLLSDSSDQDADTKVLDHLHENIRKHNAESNRKYELIFSVGVAHYDPARPFTLEELINAADVDMYRDKKSHKDSRR
jgi:diguanylate cyclase (GGDEF)-like protein/PAS domain S-box-containing protein